MTSQRWPPARSRLQQAEPVPVGQVHVEQHQVDVAVGVEEPRRVAGRAGDAGDLEAVDAADVRRVRLGRERLVLDDEHPHRHAAARPPVERHRELRAAERRRGRS